jgi:hypothetical protein
VFFLFLGEDRPGALDLRLATKAAHVRYLNAAPAEVEVLMSGPLAGPDGGEAGSAIVFRAADARQVRAFLDAEPYHLAGLYAKSEVRPWLWRRGNPYL